MHPGSAKDRMVNSIRALSSIIAKLPVEMAPEKTDGYESYIHPMRIEGSVSKSTIHLLLRDFEDTGLDSQKTILQNIISDVQKLFPQACITFTVTPTYRNMRTELDKHPHIIERLETAVKSTGVKPVWKPIRGGTDGSKLTALGLPTPNIFTGGCNMHSLTEWVSVDAMAKAAETIINLVSIS
jgi:tripeptide aminopeptidase